jgi:hypothetical protein
LGSRGLDDAILTVADYYDDPETPNLQELAGHLKRLVDGLGLLRGYRNFYIHSLQSVGRQNKPHGVVVAVLHTTEAKGRYAWVNQEVTQSELEEFRSHCERLRQYGQAIAAYLQKDNALLDPSPRKQPLSSLRTPTWPAQLKKNRDYLIKRPLPPQP